MSLTVLLSIYGIQILLYSIVIINPEIDKLSKTKIFWCSVILCLTIPLIIIIGGFNKILPNGWCGTEIFNPFIFYSILGNIGNLLIYIFISIVDKVIRKMTGR